MTGQKLPPNMGWRVWSTKDGWLNSPERKTKWESPVLHGQCKDNLPFSECFNNPSHSCGIHSTKDPWDALDQYERYGQSVVGTVRHHGTVLEGEKGYRSQNATIDTLWAPNKTVAKQLKQNYPDVAVKTSSPFSSLAARAKHERDRSKRMKANLLAWQKSPEAAKIREKYGEQKSLDRADYDLNRVLKEGAVAQLHSLALEGR